MLSARSMICEKCSFVLYRYIEMMRRLHRKKGRRIVPFISRKEKTGLYRQNLSELVFFFGLSGLLLFLIWRCFFGFANIDECFYLTIPYRICQGDKFLLHEWHMSQLSGLLLVPFMKLFLFFVDGTGGIVIAFRILYTIIWWSASVFFFCRLRRLSLFGAMVASLCFLLFAPYGIIALSYYSMGVLLFLGACILLATSEGKIELAVAGFLFAGAVLCCPYLTLLWVLFSMVALVDRLFFHKIPRKYWLYITIGAAAAFVLFCILVLINAPLSEYLKTLPFILDDPEHPMISWLEKTNYLIYDARLINPYWFGIILFSLAVILQTKLCKTFCLGFSLTCVAIVALLISYRWIYHLNNLSMFPLSLLGVFCVASSKDIEIRKLFFTIWLPGLFFSFFFAFSSNQAYFAFSCASTVMTIASILMGAHFLDIQRREKKINIQIHLIMLFFAITVMVQLFCEFSDRYQNVFWDEAGGIANQTVRAEEGPEKGIWMNQDAYDFYVITQNDLKSIRDNKRVDKVLFLSKNTWLYLSAEKKNASYSAWLSGVNDHTMYRLKQYYQMFPEKIPDVVFFDRDYVNYVPDFEAQGYMRLEEETSDYACILYKETI